MASETNSTVPNRVPLYDSQNKTPHFTHGESLADTESGEDESWDNTDWQDFLSYHAGVRR